MSQRGGSALGACSGFVGTPGGVIPRLRNRNGQFVGAQICRCQEPAERFCPLLCHENPPKPKVRKQESCLSPLRNLSIPIFLNPEQTF